MTDAEKSYSEAKDIAEKHLNKTSSMYLGLILNFSVFYYEITEQVEKAIQLAKKVSKICSFTLCMFVLNWIAA